MSMELEKLFRIFAFLVVSGAVVGAPLTDSGATAAANSNLDLLDNGSDTADILGTNTGASDASVPAGAADASDSGARTSGADAGMHAGATDAGDSSARTTGASDASVHAGAADADGSGARTTGASNASLYGTSVASADVAVYAKGAGDIGVQATGASDSGSNDASRAADTGSGKAQATGAGDVKGLATSGAAGAAGSADASARGAGAGDVRGRATGAGDAQGRDTGAVDDSSRARGAKDAKDAGSEQDDNSEVCEDERFQCDDGECIDEVYFCDDMIDCSDGSDEPDSCVQDPCDIVHVTGREGFNDGINGEYIVSGTQDGRQYYFDSSDTMYIYFYADYLFWLIGETLGSAETFAYSDQDTEIPTQGDSEWIVWNGEEWSTDEDIKVSGCVCEDDEFQCNSGECVDEHNFCDSVSNCYDGSDEPAGCDQDCEQNEFQCDDGNCIAHDLLCDGEIDCNDGSDEPAGCTEDCEQNEFQCDDGNCIVQDLLCDGEIDCNDGSDEPAGCTEEPCGDTVYVKGRVGFNEAINGVFKLSGTREGRPYYYYGVNEVYIYWYDELKLWLFAEVLGSTIVFAYGDQNVEFPYLVDSAWIVWDHENWTADEDVKVTGCVEECMLLVEFDDDHAASGIYDKVSPSFYTMDDNFYVFWHTTTDMWLLVEDTTSGVPSETDVEFQDLIGCLNANDGVHIYDIEEDWVEIREASPPRIGQISVTCYIEEPDEPESYEYEYEKSEYDSYNPYVETCCSTVLIEGGQEFNDMIDGRYDHSGPQGTCSYKRHDGDELYMYEVAGFGWVIGALEQSDAIAFVEDDALSPEEISASWMVWNGDEWIQDDTIDLECQGRCIYEADVDFIGYDEWNVTDIDSPEQCCAQHNTNDDPARVWTYSAEERTCWVKHSDDGRVYSPGKISGMFQSV